MAKRINVYRVTILATLLGAGGLFAACSSDSNPAPSVPSNGDSGTGGKATGAGGKASSGAGGASGGGTSTGGKSGTGGGGGTSSGGAQGDSGAGGAAAGGANPGDGGSCTPPQTGTFNGTPTTTTEFLNHCTNSGCIPYDNTGLPNPLPSL